VQEWLICWNDSSICNRSFENDDGWEWAQHNNTATVVNITIGDGAFLYFTGNPYNAGADIFLTFIRGNIECGFYVPGIMLMDYKLWWLDTTIWIAQMQLEKIDQYLA